ncbi:MAG: restriction endonuclease subunit S [Bacteroidetes bacterium]|nr:restriction endonuclease subunit S [Bacteroidota bacterium]
MSSSNSDTLSLSKGDMLSQSKHEWKEYKLGDVIEFGNGRVRPKSSGNIPVYGGNGILDFCNESNYESETIIIGRVGAYCGSIYYENKPIWVSDNALVAKPKENFQAKFLFYFLKNLGLNKLAEGSSHPLVTQTLLNSIAVFITDNFDEQGTIASILSSLDDKIDLLHRQNKTLEQLAETLFRQWFVEHRPELVESEADEKWEEKSLYEVIELFGGGTPKTEMPEYWGGDINWMSGKDITANHKQFILATEKTINEEGVKNSSTKILPQYTSVISARGTVGKICLLGKPMAFSQTNYGILPKIKDCYFFTYLLLSYSVDELQSASYGSVFDTITTNTFKEHKLNLPSDNIITKFEVQVSPLFYKMLSNEKQILSLTQLRDTLLPKLISGEVRVKY